MNLARTPTPSDLEKHDYRKFVSPGCLDCQGLFFLQTLVVKELQGMDIYIFIDVHKQQFWRFLLRVEGSLTLFNDTISVTISLRS